MSRLTSRCLLSFLRTGSSAHSGVTCIHPTIPKNVLTPFHHPSLPETDFSSPPSPRPCLPDSRRRRSHDASEISFRVVFVYCSAAACCHHGLRSLPPPSYPVSFAQTSNISRRATHSTLGRGKPVEASSWPQNGAPCQGESTPRKGFLNYWMVN